MVSPLPNLYALRSDALIQAQVEQRLRDLVDENKSDTKIKSMRGGSVDVVVSHRLNGHKNTFCPAVRRKEYSMISCGLHSGWMAFAA